MPVKPLTGLTDMPLATSQPPLGQQRRNRKPMILSIPCEIYMLVLALLDKRALSLCCRVSKTIYALALPLLYGKIEVLFPRYPQIPPPCPRFRGIVPGYQSITHLTIHSHPRERCEHLTSPSLPNLQTLSIVPCVFDHRLSLCQPRKGGTLWAQADRELAYSALCPLFAGLQPRHMIVRWDWRSNARPVGLSSSYEPVFPPVWLEHLTVLVGPAAYLRDRPDYHPVDKINLYGQVTSALRELTLVIQPLDADGVLRLRKMENFLGLGLSPHEGEVKLDRRICEVLASACAGDAGLVRIVGLETLDEEREERGMASGEKEAEMRNVVKRELVKKGWEGVKADDRAKAIRFEALGEYRGEVE